MTYVRGLLVLAAVLALAAAGAGAALAESPSPDVSPSPTLEGTPTPTVEPTPRPTPTEDTRPVSLSGADRARLDRIAAAIDEGSDVGRNGTVLVGIGLVVSIFCLSMIAVGTVYRRG